MGKIILRYLGRIICSIHKKVERFNTFLWIDMLTMLTPFCKKWMKMKTNSKNAILLHGFLLCVLLSRKNDKLGHFFLILFLFFKCQKRFFLCVTQVAQIRCKNSLIQFSHKVDHIARRFWIFELFCYIPLFIWIWWHLKKIIQDCTTSVYHLAQTIGKKHFRYSSTIVCSIHNIFERFRERQFGAQAHLHSRWRKIQIKF